MNRKGLIGSLVILVLLVVVASAAYSITYALNTGHETITIEEKWEKIDGGTSKYLVSSTNGQVFQITDTILMWRFDSSNMYASIKEGNTCNIKTQGWRLPILSDYKNILEIDC